MYPTRFPDTRQQQQQMRERDELKYSAEEKIVEDSESEEDESVKKTVADRREQIQKRLSIERQIPASSQKKEIVQEITEIKRHSMIEDKRAMHEEEIILQAPTDNTFKSSTTPETIVKMKTSRKDDGVDISKSEFDKELQDKFKTTIKELGDLEPQPESQTVLLAKTEPFVNTKIEYDAVVSEKSQKDSIEQLESTNLASEQTPKPKERTISTIRLLEQETEVTSSHTKELIDPELKLKLTAQKDKIVSFIEGESELPTDKIVVSAKTEPLIDPQLAAKLTAQIEKIQDFIEPEPDTSCPIKGEMKKTFSTDQIDSELSAKLSKQKEKAERIAEVESGIFEASTGEIVDSFAKDFLSEKTEITNIMQKQSSEVVKQVIESKKSELKHKTEEVITKIIDGVTETVDAKTTELTEKIDATILNQFADKKEHLESSTAKVVEVSDGAVKQIEETVLSHIKDSAEALESTKANVEDSGKERVSVLTNDGLDISEKDHTDIVCHLGRAESQVSDTVETVDTKISSVDLERPDRSTIQQDVIKEAKRTATEVVDEIVKVISQDSQVKMSVQFADQPSDESNTVVENYSATEMEVAKSSSGPFSSSTESDEFYKTIEEKITKKFSQDMSAQQDDITSQGS